MSSFQKQLQLRHDGGINENQTEKLSHPHPHKKKLKNLKLQKPVHGGKNEHL